MKNISLEVAGRVFNIQIPVDTDVEDVIFRHLDKGKKNNIEDLLKAYMSLSREMANKEEMLKQTKEKLNKIINE